MKLVLLVQLFVWSVLSVGLCLAAPVTHYYPAHGVVEKISPDLHLVTIHHDDIPNYMMSMTMDFKVLNPGELQGISIGDRINFTLIVDANDEHIEDLHRFGHVAMAATPPPVTDALPHKLKPGDMVPDPPLVSEDGKPLHLSDFRGKAVAFTFFFTRCPLPEYCPLMSRNFSEARKLLLADPKAPKNWQLVSISFDAVFDKPATLATYAHFYREDNKDRWLFAAAPSASLVALAPRVGLMIMGEDGNLSHNLRTVVIDPQGRLYRQFNNNMWKPQELVDAITAAAQVTPSK